MAGLPPPLPSNPIQLPGAASRSYNVASTWEHLAVLNEEQERAVDLISRHCAERPLPEHVQGKDASVSPAIKDEKQGTSFQGSLEEVVLENSNQFHRWHTELEAARTLETEEKYQQYAETLRGNLSMLEGLQSKVTETLALLDTLKTQHRDVAGKSRALHTSCERLVAEKDQLIQFADALRSKLAWFDELERIGAQFHSASLAVESENFLPILKRLDDCILEVTQHPQYADSAAYTSKFRQLQSRAMATIRTKMHQVLRHAADQVQLAMRDERASTSGRQNVVANGQANGKSHQAPLAEGAETALLYVRFRAAAEPGLRGLLQGLKSRAQRPEYAQLLADCQRTYCDIRLQLVADVTRARIQQYALQPLPALTRSGCSCLMQVCQMEYQLFANLFPGSDPGAGALAPLMDTLCTILYDALRPAFIQLQDLGALCQLVDILQHEVLKEQLGRRGDALAPLRPMLQRTLADIQHRLTFRAQAFIKDVVAGFKPKPEDLDYPGKLLRKQEAQPDEVQAEARSLLTDNGQPNSSDDTTKESGLDTYAAWYPPVQQTLMCLSKLYRCVEQRVFAGLAQDAVTSCTATVQLASRAVAKRSGPMDGQLFLIKQLLILREQIAPFEADFSHVEKDLDFSHMRDHLRRILVGQASLFSLSADNAMLQLVSRGGPRILENQVDSKKELEKLLKVTCEVFIMSVTKASVDPMLSFITKVTAVRVRQKPALQSTPSAPATAAAKPLREQAFAAPERVAEIVAKVREALGGALPQAIKKMQLYLNNPATHAILFRPIKSNIVEAHGQIAALLDSDYTKEEAASINLPSPKELGAILDAIC